MNRRDVLRAEQIFGPDIGALKGKTVRRQPPRVEVEEVPLPPTIQQHYQEVTLACDIMYVNIIPYLMSVSRHLRFGTAQHIKNQQGATIFNGIQAIHQIYLQRGFQICNAFMDGQFEPLLGNLAELSILLNTASNDEHVPEIERQICTVKERTRAIYCTLPFNKMLRHLIIEMVYSANCWLNMFPRKGGISKTLSPCALLTGQSWSYTTHCKLEFGDYVQTHEEHDNSMAARTIGAIALHPTGNAQGGYFFFSLTTGRVLNRGRWTSLPMPNEVIDRVHRMVRQEHGNNGLIFEDRKHNSTLMMMATTIQPTTLRTTITVTTMTTMMMRMVTMTTQARHLSLMKHIQFTTIPQRILEGMSTHSTKIIKETILTQISIQLTMITKQKWITMRMKIYLPTTKMKNIQRTV